MSLMHINNTKSLDMHCDQIFSLCVGSRLATPRTCPHRPQTDSCELKALVGIVACVLMWPCALPTTPGAQTLCLHWYRLRQQPLPLTNKLQHLTRWLICCCLFVFVLAGLPALANKGSCPKHGNSYKKCIIIWKDFHALTNRFSHGLTYCHFFIKLGVLVLFCKSLIMKFVLTLNCAKYGC